MVLANPNKSAVLGLIPVMGLNPCATRIQVSFNVILPSANLQLASVADLGEGGSVRGKSDRAEFVMA